MEFFYAYQTDKGMVRANNQDSLIIKSISCGRDRALLAAVCDGVGGLSRGEEASRRTVELLGEWAQYELPSLLEKENTGELLRVRFRQQLSEINRELFYDNCRSGISSGTTLTALILWKYWYLLGHVGDSRAYAVTHKLCQLTEDHSWVAQEAAAGRMTAEEAKNHRKRNVILKCIGAEEELEPQLNEGEIKGNTVFILCTDGFWHHVGDSEWLKYFSAEKVRDPEWLGEALSYLSSLVKTRGERDNITVIAVKVF